MGWRRRVVYEKPITIKAVIVDPPVIPSDGTATIVVEARNERGWPMKIEVSASEGFVEPTDEWNVFLWHGPRSLRRRSRLFRAPVASRA